MKRLTLFLIALSISGTACASPRRPLVIASGQVQQIQPTDTLTLPNTYSSLNASQTTVDVNVGGCIATDYPGGAPGNYSTTAISGCVVTPTGTYTGGTATWPDAGITAIAINANAGANKTSVPLFTFGGTSVSGAYVYGANINSLNCRNYAAGCTYNTGFDTVVQYGLEVDTNRYSKAASATPSGTVYGILSQLFGDTQSTTAMGAFVAVGSPYGGAGAVKWDNAYATTDAAATYGAFYNSQCVASGTCSSQDIRLVSRASGTPQYADLVEDSSGFLQLTGPAGVVANNPFYVHHNAAGVLPPSCGTGLAVTSNYSNSAFEADMLNCANAGGGFKWYQKTGAATATLLATLDTSGNLTIPNTLTAGNGTLGGVLKLGALLYAGLPTCNSGQSGTVAYITDASAAITAWHQTVSAGGGSNKALLYCNGTNWLALG